MKILRNFFFLKNFKCINYYIYCFDQHLKTEIFRNYTAVIVDN